MFFLQTLLTLKSGVKFTLILVTGYPADIGNSFMRILLVEDEPDLGGGD